MHKGSKGVEKQERVNKEQLESLELDLSDATSRMTDAHELTKTSKAFSFPFLYRHMLMKMAYKGKQEMCFAKTFRVLSFA